MLRRFISIISHAFYKLGIGFDARNHPAVRVMEQRIQELGSLHFKVEFHSDGSWTAESVNLDGIITGSNNPRDMNAVMKDAIFTYFGIPAYFSHDELLQTNNEPITMQQRVWATQ